MTNQLVECIPNFSEARRPDVVEKIMDSIKSVAGVHILDHHSDLDHNRTVVTYVGSPKAVEEAAFQAIKTASLLINLDEHQGEHPRMGATDVVPFVPISDVTSQDCIEMARRLGKKVGQELNIPVFLYEDAAAIPEKQNLEKIRFGQYEALKKEIGTTPVRTPDFGPNTVGPAGATVIGSRQPLIAFNIYLTTSDVSIAQKIARVVRNSSGGLRYVKGMGVLVEGLAQVSMNLTNYKKTSIARVVEFVRREAQRYGVGIHHSELVGLIPQEALIDSAVWYTQLDGFTSEQILEQRLYKESTPPTVDSTDSSQTFLDQLASATPTPGGGSAAAFSASAGAALVAMVARLTTGKKKYEDVQDRMWALLEKAELLRTALSEAVIKDSQAFDDVMASFKLPKNTTEEQEIRLNAIQAATIVAAEVPLSAAKMALEVMEYGFEAATFGNTNAISDAASAMYLAKAGLQSACLNVQINAININDQQIVDNLLSEVKEITQQAEKLESQIKGILVERGGFPQE
jgi:glutamate formiminotransferase/formiminotetrahydrofolate cyclodeaminase